MEQLEQWKKEIGEIPENTCPDIDKILVIARDCNRNVSYLVKNAHKYESATELAEALDFDFSLDIDSELENLRESNSKLRELGKFWYEKCEELLTKTT